MCPGFGVPVMEHAEQDDEPISLSRRYADWIPRLVLGSAVSRRAGAQ